jgi:hypothetical protein
MKEKTINIKYINIISLIITPVFFSMVIVPYLYFMREKTDTIFSPIDFVFLFISVIISFLIHELIHAIAFMKYTKHGYKSIKFGILWKYMALYCHCNEFITVGQYRIVLIMPSIILGFIPIILGFCIPNFIILLFGCVMTMGGIGDFFCIWILRNFKKNTMVMDHPDKVGFFYEENVHKSARNSSVSQVID